MTRATRPRTSCSSAARRCSSAATTPRPPSSSSAPTASKPRKGSILEALGRAYFNSGQAERARLTFEALLDVDPSSHYGHFALGQSLKRLGRREEAGTHLRLAVALSPGTTLYRGALERLGFSPFNEKFRNYHAPSSPRRSARAAEAGQATRSPYDPRSRASQSSATSVLPSRNSPRSAAATASCQGIRSRIRCSSSSGPSRSPSAGRRSVAR